MNIVIVEDNEKDYTIFQKCVEKYECENDSKIFVTRYTSALDFLSEYKYDTDIVFMDIELPDINGLEASRRLRVLDKNVILIFITNMAQYAVNGYEVAALDYVVKPYRYSDFVSKIKRAQSIIVRKETVNLIVKVEGGRRMISLSEVVYVEVVAHRLVFHLVNETIETWGTLKEIENKWGSKSGLKKCNHCYLVNLRYVKGIKDNKVRVGDEELMISRNKKKEFLMSLAEYLGEGNKLC